MISYFRYAVFALTGITLIVTSSMIVFYTRDADKPKYSQTIVGQNESDFPQSIIKETYYDRERTTFTASQHGANHSNVKMIPRANGESNYSNLTSEDNASLQSTLTLEDDASQQSTPTLEDDASQQSSPKSGEDASQRGKQSCPCGRLKSTEQGGQRFLPVEGHHIYSAYYDDRQLQPIVFIVGLGNTDSVNKRALFCILWYNESHCDVTIPTIRKVSPKPSRNPSQVFTCPSPDKGTIPKHVTITPNTEKCLTEGATLLITYDRKWPPKRNLTVCVHGGLKYNISHVAFVMEFLEVYSMLGADKFAIYNHSGGAALRPLMQLYQKKGILDFFDWSMSPDTSSENVGQGALIQDCIYRYMYHSRYVLMVNLDEFIIPRQHDNLVNMVLNSACKDSPAIIFRNTFFSCEFPNDTLITTNETLKHLNSLVLSRTTRDDYIMKVRTRSKYMVRPDLTVQGGTHFVDKVLRGGSCTIPPDLALLHHYKCRLKSWYSQVLGHMVPAVVDRTSHRFMEQIVDRLTDATRQVSNSLQDNNST